MLASKLNPSLQASDPLFDGFDVTFAAVDRSRQPCELLPHGRDLHTVPGNLAFQIRDVGTDRPQVFKYQALDVFSHGNRKIRLLCWW